MSLQLPQSYGIIISTMDINSKSWSLTEDSLIPNLVWSHGFCKSQQSATLPSFAMTSELLPGTAELYLFLVSSSGFVELTIKVSLKQS